MIRIEHQVVLPKFRLHSTYQFRIYLRLYFNSNVFILNKMHASRHADKEVLISVNSSCIFYGSILFSRTCNIINYIQFYYTEKIVLNFTNCLLFKYVRIICLWSWSHHQVFQLDWINYVTYFVCVRHTKWSGTKRSEL